MTIYWYLILPHKQTRSDIISKLASVGLQILCTALPTATDVLGILSRNPWKHVIEKSASIILSNHNRDGGIRMMNEFRGRQYWPQRFERNGCKRRSRFVPWGRWQASESSSVPSSG